MVLLAPAFLFVSFAGPASASAAVSGHHSHSGAAHQAAKAARRYRPPHGAPLSRAWSKVFHPRHASRGVLALRGEPLRSSAVRAFRPTPPAPGMMVRPFACQLPSAPGSVTAAAGANQPPRGFYYSERTTFDVTIGKNYSILGLGIFATVLLALACDDTKKPNWLPAGLFELSGIELPKHWKFSVLDGVAASGGDASNRWLARWGYAELVEDDTHSDALIERDQAALEIFFRHLREDDQCDN